MSWDDLVAVALIGTDRRPVAATVPPGSPDGLEAALAERGVEDRLLGAAAAWTVARRAGALAAEPAAVEPAGVDARPVCPDAAGARLRAFLEGEHPELVPEWLALVADAGLRPPPELLPDLLDHAAGEPSLHAVVGAAAGPLGGWLAERAPRWAFVRGAADDVEAVWASGERAERQALLERLRATDPAEARELLAGTFAEETWEDRAAFLAALAHDLSDADEPLLERALDDARKPVREAAATLLTRLPHSRYTARMAQRAAPLVRIEGGRLAAELPGAPDAAALRDGLPASGLRAERLRALLAATPLSTWTGSPRELVALPVADDLAGIVHAGWAGAAKAQRDAEWARALWPVHPDAGLLRALPPADGQALAAAEAEPDVAARALPGPWGPELSRAVIAAIHRRRAAGERGHDVAFAGYRLDPGLALEAEVLREVGGRDVHTLCDTLATRAAMLRELS